MLTDLVKWLSKKNRSIRIENRDCGTFGTLTSKKRYLLLEKEESEEFSDFIARLLAEWKKGA